MSGTFEETNDLLQQRDKLSLSSMTSRFQHRLPPVTVMDRLRSGLSATQISSMLALPDIFISSSLLQAINDGSMIKTSLNFKEEETNLEKPYKRKSAFKSSTTTQRENFRSIELERDIERV